MLCIPGKLRVSVSETILLRGGVLATISFQKVWSHRGLFILDVERTRRQIWSAFFPSLCIYSRAVSWVVSRGSIQGNRDTKCMNIGQTQCITIYQTQKVKYLMYIAICPLCDVENIQLSEAWNKIPSWNMSEYFFFFFFNIVALPSFS